jgi:polysaccharide biosynthesis protein PslH
MKVLFVVPYAPTRIRTRPFHLIRALASEGHRVSLATLCTSEAEVDAVERLSQGLDVVLAERIHLSRSIWNCLRALPNRRPIQACYSWSPSLARKVVRLAEQSCFDVIHVEHLRGVRYGLLLKKATAVLQGKRPAVIWDSVDCISSLFHKAARESSTARSRLAARVELARTEHYEGWLTTRFDQVLVTSEKDRVELLKLAGRWSGLQGSGSACGVETRVQVVPNGVDLEYFSPSVEPRDPQTIVISGKMSYHANVTGVVHFVNEVMPGIWSELPDVRLWIVGKDPPSEVRRLGTAWSSIQAPPPPRNGGRDSRVLITGTVEDIRPFLHRATIAVAPIRYGAGIQNKVLEALASGLPVVATPDAVSALGVRPGHDLLVAQEADELAASILSLLRNPELCSRLGHAGRLMVEQHHEWRSVARGLTRIYREANA